VTHFVASVDLGATSGRVVAAEVGRDAFRISEVHRFANEPVRERDGLHWDISRIFDEVVVGVIKARELAGDLVSIAIDSWGVDFGLLDESGRLLGNPFHYRDARHSRGVIAVEARITPAELYARNGLQFLPFNTLYQLAADQLEQQLDVAVSMLLIPDLLGFWLTGRRASELTNSSTTGLLSVASRDWDDELIGRLGFRRELFQPLAAPGTALGTVSRGADQTANIRGAQVTVVGSHDTASAVVGVPATEPGFAYISCGTWALVGLELEAPVVSEEARLARFTNEAGLDGRTRFLHNVTGLWLLQESLRTWRHEGADLDLDELLDAAAALPAGGPVIDPNSDEFIAPGDMPARIAEACRVQGQRPPGSRPEIVRCILESMALAFAGSIQVAEGLSGRQATVIHIVGGGSQNRLLCQLTANAAERPVVAGPAEATAIGNILIQGRAIGLLSGSLEDLRRLIARHQALTRFEPSSSLSHSP
jgi:rhamnulokinase